MEVAGAVAVEIRLDIELIVTESLVAADYAEEQAGSGGSSVEMAHFGRIGVHWNQVRRKARSGDGAPIVVIPAHAHCAAKAHGQCGVLAQKQEIRSHGVLVVAELLVIEVGYDVTHRVEISAHVGVGRPPVDVDDFGVGKQAVGLHVGEAPGADSGWERTQQRHCEDSEPIGHNVTFFQNSDYDLNFNIRRGV